MPSRAVASSAFHPCELQELFMSFHAHFRRSLRRLVLSAALLGVLSPAVHAQNPLSTAAGGGLAGRVLRADGHPAAGVVVQLIERRLSATTGADGAFRFESLPAGSYRLEVESPQGEAAARIAVAAGAVARVELRLELLHHDDEIVVTGGLVRSQLELAQATTVLHGEELAQRLQPSLGETLAQQPGISSTFFGAGASRPVIRGLGGDRVRMLQAGIDAGDVSSTSPDHAVAAEPGLAERIEVLRGPATLLYGSSAIGGVVNVFDESIAEQPLEVPLTGHLELGGGSVDDARSANLALSGGAGSWAWYAGGLWREAGDYEIPGAAEAEHEGHGEEEHEEHEEIVGKLPNSDLESRSATLGASRFFGDHGFVGVSVSTYDSEYGVPAGHEHEEEGEHEEEEGEHEEEGLRIDMQRRRFDLRAESTQGFGPFQGFRGRVGLVDYEHAEIEPGGQVGTTFFNDSVEGRLELVQRQRGSWSGSVGVQVARRELEAIGDEAFIPPIASDLTAAFGFQEVERLGGRLRLQFGGRYERQSNEARPAELEDRSFEGFSGSFGAVYQLGGTYAVAASVARSVKLPNGEELYAFGPHLATSTFEVGNLALEEERSVGIDVSLRKTRGRFTGEVSLFRNAFSDFIYQRFTGEELDGLPVVLATQADAYFHGAEVIARIALVERDDHHLDLQLQGDFVRAELAEGGNLPRIPPRRLSAGLHYRRGPLSTFVEIWDVAGQDRVAENETPTDGYHLVHAGGTYQWLVGDQALALVLRARNLGNAEARNHVSFLKDAVPLPGRDLGLSLRWSF
jgi:iron complex outermembrane receptor protein